MATAMAAVTMTCECPICYWKEREKRSVSGVPWPRRARWEAVVAQPCALCGTLTYWRVAGPWEPGKPVKQPLEKAG